MTEQVLLEQWSSVRYDTLMMISLIISLALGYVVALTSFLGSRSISERGFAFFLFTVILLFFLIQFGVPLRLEILAIIDDLKALGDKSAELSLLSRSITDPCSRLASSFPLLSGLFGSDGSCEFYPDLFRISDIATVVVWFILLLLTLFYPWRKVRQAGKGT